MEQAALFTIFGGTGDLAKRKTISFAISPI